MTSNSRELIFNLMRAIPERRQPVSHTAGYVVYVVYVVYVEAHYGRVLMAARQIGRSEARAVR